MGEGLLNAHGLSQNPGEGYLLGPHCAREAPLANSPIYYIVCQTSKGQPALHVVQLARVA